uniref:Phospholipid/glycerol acyltransferase domain-containing protein n=1 Tax=Plectus sambesii TaxID=2011161 RepID=A0A914WNJ1_9BILA
MTAFLNRARGGLFAVLLFLTSFLGAIFILVPFFPFIFIRPTIWRHCADKLVGYWLTFPAALCEFLFGIKFHITGDPIVFAEPALIIMNHRTRLDWLFFWNALYKIDPWLLTTEKISLKASLKLIPGAGWAMGCDSFMFLHRNWEMDKRNIEKMIAYYKDIGQNYQLLLFPEGTDRGTRSVDISRSFAEKNNLPFYDYLLHPRTTGFTFLLKHMRQKNYAMNIYDVTVGYPDEIVANEVDLISTGVTPRNVHFDIRKVAISEVPEDDDGAAKWLSKLWSDKEGILRKFYSKPPADRAFTPSGIGAKWPVETTGWGRYAAFAFWILTTTMWAVFIYQFFAVKVYTIACIALYIGIHRRYGGVELPVKMGEPDDGPPPTVLDRVRGLTFTVVLFMSSLLGTIYILIPLFPLVVLSPKWWRKIVDRLIGFWLTLPPSLISFLFGAKFRVTGDPVLSNEPALIIMNHRTRLDWLFFWNALYKIDPLLLTTEKISLKAILRLIPGAGWAMGANSFLFLDRLWEKDEKRLEDMIDYYANVGAQYQILLFPEGTDKCHRATARCRAFAEKKGLQQYEYIMHPKTTGFVYLLQKMRKVNYIKYVYDVTVAFPDRMVQSETDIMLKGACPKTVHFDIRRLDVDRLPESDEGLAKWLIALWKDKEDILREYYEKPLEERQLQPSGEGIVWPIEDSVGERAGLLFAFSFWLLTTLMWIWFLWTVGGMRWYFILSCCVYALLYRVYGGVEWFAVSEWKRANPIHPTCAEDHKKI